MASLTPYVVPSMIINAPTGISWSIIPFPKSTSQQQLAEQYNMCHRATATVNGVVNQVFRSTVDNEQRSGPGDYRINIEQATGNVRWILSRWPVTQILAGQVSANGAIPRQWTQIPPTSMDIENPVIGVYGTSTPGGSGSGGGQSVLIGGGYGGWGAGRNGFRFAISYENGWPHAGITANVLAGATTIRVDDVTGMTGAAVTIYDGADTEYVTVASAVADTPLVLPNGGGTAQAGPGTLTLTAGTTFAHAGASPSTVVISAIPGDVLWATILATTAQALEAGITSISIQNLPGSLTQGGHGVSDIKTEYELILDPYRRVV
jgi:hypothetical protein